jgi:ABC-type sugar transport system ATPase subunit
MASVSVKQLVKRFDQNIAVNHLDLDVRDGEFMVFLGPSGCGKTTTLRCISGLEIPDDGEIRIGDEIVTKKEPAERDIAFVFQSFSLYPHMTVREILAFPLRAVRTPESEITQRVAEAAKTLHIEKLLDRKPGKLSGGEMQRVAIARALVNQPRFLLADEPTGNLDSVNSAAILRLFQELRQDGLTIIAVTHNEEFARSADRRLTLRDGKVVS